MSERRPINLTVPKATAKLIILLAEPHVNKALDDGDADRAMTFQSIITTLNLALEIGAPIEFK